MELTGVSFFFPWEVSLMEWLQATLGSAAKVISSLSFFGEAYALMVLMGFFYWWYDKRMGKTLGLTVLMGLVFNPLAKNIACRRRPYMDHESIKILRVVDPSADPMDIAAQRYSFPSGHSCNAAATYGSAAEVLKKRWATVLAVILSLLVGFSRVAVGAHYPTDVIAGLLMGAVCVFLIPWLQKKIPNELTLYGILLLVSIPGFFYCRSTDYFDGIGLLIGFMAGTLLDSRVVHFENTRSVFFGVLRMVMGFALYFGLYKLLKLPFQKEFLNSGTTAALLVRCAIFAVIAFVEFGVYPMAFAPVEKALSGLKKS